MSQTVRLRPLTLTIGQYGAILAALDMYIEQADENQSANTRDMARRAVEKIEKARR